MSLFQDKVFALAVTASMMLHVVALYGIPTSRLGREEQVEDSYIEFVYYHVQADEPPPEPMEEAAALEPIEAVPAGLREPVVVQEEAAEPLEEPIAKGLDQKINVKVKEKSLQPPEGAGEFYEEGRLINEYARTLDRIIVRNRPSYPSHPRNRSLEGSVLLYLRVSKDGSLRSVTARKDSRSGSREFQKAAIDAVKRASQDFPPFPDGLKRNEILFNLPISFTLEY